MATLVVIGGSTASGKSTLAMRVAAGLGGIVVNADSQQVFRDLPTLTARPTAADEAALPHRLYGMLEPTATPSVGRWLEQVRVVLDEAEAAGRPLVLVGGSGLYLEALLHGIAAVPPVPDAVRQEVRQLGASLPVAELHRRLLSVDPVLARRLRPGDRQRILRALEVVQGTGRSLAHWQACPPRRLTLPDRIVGVALLPPAASVGVRIERRVAHMLAGGAVGEVRALAARLSDLAELPIAKVLGVTPLLEHLRGVSTLDEAGTVLAGQVRRYAKRQRTFFRGRLADLRPLPVTGDEPALAPGLIELGRRH